MGPVKSWHEHVAAGVGLGAAVASGNPGSRLTSCHTPCVTDLQTGVSSSRRKLAQTLSETIEREVRVMGWPVGVSLGNEAELLHRHGVSRAVLREAIRILESNYVAKMKPGPGGGLIVVKPDPTTIIRAMARQLEFNSVTETEILHARTAIELECLELVMARHDDVVVSMLTDCLREEEALVERGDLHAGQMFHMRLAELSGNGALLIFVEVMVRLSQARFGAQAHASVQSSELSADTHRIHRLIAQTIIEGDGVKAANYMRAHLRATTPFWAADGS